MNKLLMPDTFILKMIKKTQISILCNTKLE